MGDYIPKLKRGQTVIPVASDLDGNEGLPMQIDTIAGVRRLRTDAIAQIEQIFGQDNQADSWFAIGTPNDISTITVGDTVRVQIAAGPDATLYPAIDLTYTVVQEDVDADNPELAVAEKIVTMLNNDSVFKVLWQSKRVVDNSIVWIGSRIYAEWSERPNSGDFAVTTTGTIVVTVGYDTLVRRGKKTTITKDPYDPRIGFLGITGEVVQTVKEVGELYIENLEQDPHGSGLIGMNVDGSVTPVTFWIRPLVDKDIFINEIRWYSTSASVKFGQFLNQPNPLTNGIKIEIKADDSYLLLPLYKSTEDFKNKFSNGIWSLEAQPSLTSILATFQLDAPFPIRYQGKFATDDYVKVTIQDDLLNIASLEMLVFGFTRSVT